MRFGNSFKIILIKVIISQLKAYFFFYQKKKNIISERKCGRGKPYEKTDYTIDLIFKWFDRLLAYTVALIVFLPLLVTSYLLWKKDSSPWILPIRVK